MGNGVDAEGARQAAGTGRVTEPAKFLEESAIHWRRDFDAVLLGFILGVLVTLVVR